MILFQIIMTLFIAQQKLKQKTDLFIGYASSVNKNKPAPKTDDHVRILKHKIIFAKILAGEKLKILFQEQIILNTWLGRQ